jgi:hypothetical protein
MIKAKVYFGNGNSFTVDLGIGTVCGDLVNLLPMAIGKSYKDVAYCICNGVLIGTEGCHLDKPLIDMGIVNGECTVHLVLNVVSDDPLDNIIRYRYGMWIIKKNINVFAAAGHDAFVDVPVLIERERLHTVIEQTAATGMDTCSICAADIIAEASCIKNCRHVFHTSCISRWLTESSVKCPMCNADVRN